MVGEMGGNGGVRWRGRLKRAENEDSMTGVEAVSRMSSCSWFDNWVDGGTMR